MLHMSKSGRRMRRTRAERNLAISSFPVCPRCYPIYSCVNMIFPLAESNSGAGFIHKSKLNSNGSFSVGKTWKLSELRGIEVLNVSPSVNYDLSQDPHRHP